MAHQLPPLPYDYSALEPYIDTQTMKLHHDMHHGTYVKNLNAALEKYPKLQSQAAEDLLRDLNAVPEDIRTTVRNNGGGHVNHTMFWKIMKPKGGGEPGGACAQYDHIRVLRHWEFLTTDATEEACELSVILGDLCGWQMPEVTGWPVRARGVLISEIRNAC